MRASSRTGLARASNTPGTSVSLNNPDFEFIYFVSLLNEKKAVKVSQVWRDLIKSQSDKYNPKIGGFHADDDELNFYS